MNWVNYADVLAQMQASGLLVDGLVGTDVGTRRRCRIDGDRERRGWYHLHELRLESGSTMLVGSFGVWRGTDPGTQKVSLKGQQLSDEQRAALRERILTDQRRETARRAVEGERAARRASAMWQRLAETGASEYLKRKRVDAIGVRFSPQGAVVVPMQDANGLVHGLQLISPPGSARAKRVGRDKDFWPAGLVKQGRFCLLGAAVRPWCILVAEGYATAASLHMATRLPVAVAFDAGNLVHVARALASRYPGAKLLVCGDDDYLSRCRACGALTPAADGACTHCGKADHSGNAGVLGADAAALAVGGAWLVPQFADDRPLDSKGATDFNDLHCAEGMQAVAAQVDARLTALGWSERGEAAPASAAGGEGEGAGLTSILSVMQYLSRFALVYEMTETVFDGDEHKLVPMSSMRNLACDKRLHRAWLDSADKRIVRVTEVGFDPTEADPKVKCNLWGGWPTQASSAGSCERLLQLGEYLCSHDARGSELWGWLQRWMAYPVVHHGAKMKTALVFHGPQGTGKNVFFEAYASIYGEYAKVIDQEAVEDKFNDSFSRKLLILADEVVARQELYHTKNKLKGLVTGTEIRINPKNVGAYFERNHMNIVFMSNEPQPLVLERDDRRYCVVWTPPKLEPAFYNEVLAEIKAGGCAALHHHLLHNVDLAGFGPATLPPMTDAKRELIERSSDSIQRFYDRWIARELPLPVGHVRTEDLYEAYQHWCSKEGEVKTASANAFVFTLCKVGGAAKDRKRHYVEHSQTVTTMSTVFFPPGAERDPARDELSAGLVSFSDAVSSWKSQKRGSAPDGPAYSHDDEPF